MFRDALISGAVGVLLSPLAETPAEAVEDTGHEPGIVAAYAEEWAVSDAEAVAQLDIQEVLDTIDYATVDARFSEVYTTPGTQFGIQYLSAAPEIPEPVTAAWRLVGVDQLVTHEQVAHSLAEMTAAQERAKEALLHVGMRADLDIDFAADEVVAYTTSAPSSSQDDEVAQAVRGRSAEPGAGPNLRWVLTESLAKPAVGGGRAMRTCTAGFVVARIGTGDRGVSTAGHCPSYQTYRGEDLTHRGEAFGLHSDVQWHDSLNLFWHRRFFDGTSDRQQTDRKRWGGMNRNDSVCKHGKITGYDCGYIATKYFCPGYVPSCANTFVRVNNSARDMCEPGDSGGPYFTGGTAWGLQSGEVGPNAGIFMPQQYMSGLNIRVALAP